MFKATLSAENSGNLSDCRDCRLSHLAVPSQEAQPVSLHFP